MRTSTAALALIQKTEDGQAHWFAQWNSGWEAYSFIGGHKHPDESFRECLIREMHEELGLIEGRDYTLPATAAHHLEYEAWSQRADEQTAYVIELFHVGISRPADLPEVYASRKNRWLNEEEIRAQRTSDGEAVSETMPDLLIKACLIRE